MNICKIFSCRPTQNCSIFLLHQLYHNGSNLPGSKTKYSMLPSSPLTPTCSTSCQILTISSPKSLIASYPLLFLIFPFPTGFPVPSPSNPHSSQNVLYWNEVSCWNKIWIMSHFCPKTFQWSKFLSCEIQDPPQFPLNLSFWHYVTPFLFMPPNR